MKEKIEKKSTIYVFISCDEKYISSVMLYLEKAIVIIEASSVYGDDNILAKGYANTSEILEFQTNLVKIKGIQNTRIIHAVNNKNKEHITRSIVFSDEYRQAGISILSYFSEIIYQKYPEKKVSIKIEQKGLIVRLHILTKEGDKEIVEKTLDDYGKAITGEYKPEDILKNSTHIEQLKNKLDLAKLEIYQNKKILKIQDETIKTLNSSLKSICKINYKSHQSIKILVEKKLLLSTCF